MFKLILILASTVNDKFANSFLKLIETYLGAFLDFINRLKTGKDVKCFIMEEVSVYNLLNDFKNVDHISKHGVIGTMYLRYSIILIKKKRSMI